MRALARTVASVLAAVWAVCPATAETCSDSAGGIGVARIVEIDASTGPLYGDMSKYTREDSFLGPKEVVLTFDDGPIPHITKSILDTLDKFCTKATFFSVGRMAIAYPATVKEVMARGHTLGSHTWSHPFNLKRSAIERSRDEIERGFAAVAMAAGQPIAPFFRFPGLSDSDPMLAHLQTRGVAAFTVDVVSNDSYIGDPKRLTERTIKQVEARDGGIILFHDIKASTAKALPEILTQLKARGFKVVHMRSKATFTPLTEFDAALQPMLAQAQKTAANSKHNLMPFYGTIGPEKNGREASKRENLATAKPVQDTASIEKPAPEAAPATAVAAVTADIQAPVTQLAPAARTRQSEAAGSTRNANAGRTRKDRVVETDATAPRERASPSRGRRHRQLQPASFFN